MSPRKKKLAEPVNTLVQVGSVTADFDEVLGLIEAARTRAFAAVNHELVGLYWQIGEYISRKLESAAWGEGVVQQLANHIARQHPDLKGFARPNLFRMRQFFETYKDDVKVSPLVRQLPWTHNILILSRSKRPEEREFYLRMTLQERWTKRELERQLSGALFERVVVSPLAAPQSWPRIDLPLKLDQDLTLLLSSYCLRPCSAAYLFASSR